MAVNFPIAMPLDVIYQYQEVITKLLHREFSHLNKIQQREIILEFSP